MPAAKPKKKKVTISKHYERKVNLTAISSQFDNISVGTFISGEVEVTNDEELVEELRSLKKMVFEENERDIKEIFVDLKKMSEDKKNKALVGTGTTLELPDESDKPTPKEDEPKKIESKKVEPKKDEKVEEGPKKDDKKSITDWFQDEEPSEMEEIDIESFDEDAYQGDLLK